MAFTELQRCWLTGEAILFGSWYQNTSPGRLNERKSPDYCEVHDTFGHGSSLFWREFDAMLPRNEVESILGAPYIGTPAGRAITGRNRDELKRLELMRNTSQQSE